MNLLKLTLSVLLCLLVRVVCMAQTGNKDSLAMFAASLRQHPQERVFLHFDRTHYFPGDTIYFKAYTVFGQAHTLSQLSKVLYIDVLRDDSTTVSSTTTCVSLYIIKNKRSIL